jgi:hypothetical protein
MAKVFAVPAELGQPPALDIKNVKGYQQATAEWVAKVQKWAKQNGTGKLAGKLYKSPVADGYAEYVVFRGAPLQMIHLPIYDAYRLHPAMERGLSAKDVEASMKWDELIKAKAAA